MRNGSLQVAAACAAVGITAGLLGAMATMSEFALEPSAIVRMEANEPLAPVARAENPDFALWGVGHYDGVYFYAIGADPLARGIHHERIDKGAFRYVHPGMGWVAWAASLGRPEAVPAALLTIGVVSLGAAAGLTSRIADRAGRSPWAGLFVALNPGLLFAVTAATTEPLGVAVLAAAILAWGGKRYRWAAVAVAALCLIREYFLVVPVALAAWELLKARRGHRDLGLGARLASLAAGPVLFGCWYLYLSVTFGADPFSQGAHVLNFPLQGWVESLSQAVIDSRHDTEGNQVGAAAVPLLIAFLGATIAGVIQSTRLRSLLDVVFLPLAGLVLMLDVVSIVYPKDLVRALAVVSILLPGVLLSPTRGPLVGPGSSTDEDEEGFDEPGRRLMGAGAGGPHN